MERESDYDIDGLDPSEEYFRKKKVMLIIILISLLKNQSRHIINGWINPMNNQYILCFSDSLWIFGAKSSIAIIYTIQDGIQNGIQNYYSFLIYINRIILMCYFYTSFCNIEKSYFLSFKLINLRENKLF